VQLILKGSRNKRGKLSFFAIFHRNEHAIVKFWKPQQIQKVSHRKALASKIICTQFLSPIFRHSWEIRWFIFNELTVHSTKSPVKHCPISKRKIFPDSGDWALSSQACARKIWDIRAHPNLQCIYSLLTVYLQYTYSIITVYLQFTYSVFTVYLQFTYSVLTVYLQFTYNLLTVYLQFTYSVLKVYLQFTYSILTVYLKFTYSLLTVYLQFPYSLLTVYLQFTYRLLTVYLQCTYSLLTVYLQYTYSFLTV
jgi:hypothetical protein